MGTTIRKGAALIGILALPVLAATGCTSNPVLPTEVLFLQVYDINVGTGQEATAGDRIMIDYVTWIYDSAQAENKGRQLDARSGYTFFLGANQVIPAFDQGLVGMRVGGKRLLVIPPEYAQGGTVFGSVPRNTPLVAEVDLVEVQTVPR